MSNNDENSPIDCSESKDTNGNENNNSLNEQRVKASMSLQADMAVDGPSQDAQDDLMLTQNRQNINDTSQLYIDDREIAELKINYEQKLDQLT